MKRYFGLVLLVLAVAFTEARAQGLDDQYVQIFNLIQEGDAISGTDARQAVAKYTEAQRRLETIKRSSPSWNPSVINFRLDYVSTQIAALSPRVPATPATPATAVPKPIVQPPGPAPVLLEQPGAPSDWEAQLNTLREQARQLQADKSVLEKKLREALSIQPAPMDPRELARAEQRILTLQKENDLLKTALQSNRPAASATKTALAQAQSDLRDAQQRLASESRRADALAAEKKALQDRLENLIPAPGNAKALQDAKKSLKAVETKLAQQTETADRLASEKAALQARVDALTIEAASAASLRAENASLKKQLAEPKPAPQAQPSEDVRRQLAEARAEIAALRSDKELMRLERIALENRLKSSSGLTAASVVLPPPAPVEDPGRIRKLERERDDLQKKLDAANKELYGRKGKAAAARVQELEAQLAAARARLETFEARQVPYTAEELALFQKPDATLPSPDSPVSKKSIRDLSPESAKMAAEARGYFGSGNFDKAEEAYLQVLRKDQNNIPVLVNLATTQLQLKNYSAAETNLTQALAIDPNDAYALSVLGLLRFEQRRIDDAVDALSRAAKLDPKNAEIQNHLGLALSEKGLRGPAETALRKAVQIDPGYASAHCNLAVIYLTQKPPMTELARWHYQKAIAAGHPPNAEVEKLLEARK